MKFIFSSLVIILCILVLGAYIGWNVIQDSLGLRPDEIRVYYLKGERLAQVRKPLLAGQQPVRDSLYQLLVGPGAEELKKGYFSTLPAQLKLLGYSVEGDTIVLKLNEGFDHMTGGSSQIRAAVAQLVYTATAQRGIKKVVLSVVGREGKPLIIGGEGYTVDKVLTREDVAL